MKKLYLVVCFLLLSVPVFGADVTIKWDTQTDATGFRIYRSLDLGKTWTQAGSDLGAVTTVKLTGEPDTGLVLYRVAAFNSAGETIRFDAGAWYWGDAPKPPATPTGPGIK